MRLKRIFTTNEKIKNHKETKHTKGPTAGINPFNTELVVTGGVDQGFSPVEKSNCQMST